MIFPSYLHYNKQTGFMFKPCSLSVKERLHGFLHFFTPTVCGIREKACIFYLEECNKKGSEII
jgi:hypothetical protein